MASLDFPSNPVDQQQYTLNGIVYYYNAAIGAWLTVLSSKLSDTSSNTQVLFNDSGVSNGSYGLIFNKSANTLYAKSINVINNMSVAGDFTSGGVVQALTTVQSSSGADLNLNANGANRDIIMKVNGTELARLIGSTSKLDVASRGITKGSMPAGSILQVQQAVITSVFSTTSTSFTDITSLGISITPTSTTSKILVMISLYRGCASAVITNFRLTRAGTPIYLGDAAGSRVQSSGAFYVGNSDNQAHIGPVDIKYVDSPSTTSAITYQVQMRTQGGETVYVGRTGGDSDGGAYPRIPASIIVMEIAQ